MLSSSQALELPLFDQLPPEQWGEVESLLHERRYRKGEELISPKTLCGEVYIIIRGSVKVLIRRPDCAEMLLAVLGRGEVIGELSAIDGGQHSATVTALEDALVLALDVQDFVSLIKTDQTINWNLVTMLSRRLRRVSGQAEALATLDVTGRLSRQLLAFADDYGKELPKGGVLIPIRLTQSDLASLVGASREKINRVINRLKSQGAVAVSVDGRLVLLNSSLLTKLSQQHQA